MFSAETSQSKEIRCTSCNINVFRVILRFSMRRELQSYIKFSIRTTLTILATTFTPSGTSEATEKKYYDYKLTAKTLPSVAYLTNSQLVHINKLLTVSGWDGLSTTLEQYVDQRLNQSFRSTHPKLTIVQSTPLVRLQMTQQMQPVNAITRTTSAQKLEDDNIVCDISIQADQAWLCQAKQSYDLVLGKTDVSLVKNFLTTFDFPHLDTKALIQKLAEVAKTVDLDVSTFLEEQMEDQVLGTVRSWIRKNTLPDTKSPEIQQPKGFLRYCQEFNRLLIEEEGQLLCSNEPSDKLEEDNLRICLPLPLFPACFRLGHHNEMGRHMGGTKTYANAKKFYYWPGMFDWTCALTADCFTCQNNKPKPKHRIEVSLEEWQSETVPFRTIHIDHKGPIHPTSAKNAQCRLIVDAFSWFLMVYPVRNTTALATITAVAKWILFLGSHYQSSMIEALLLSIQSSSTGPKNV